MQQRTRPTRQFSDRNHAARATRKSVVQVVTDKMIATAELNHRISNPSNYGMSKADALALARNFTAELNKHTKIVSERTW